MFESLGTENESVSKGLPAPGCQNETTDPQVRLRCLGSVPTTQACQQQRDSNRLVLSAKHHAAESGPAVLAEGVTWHMATRSLETAPKGRPLPSRVRCGPPEQASLSHQCSFEEGWKHHWAATTLAGTLHILVSPASKLYCLRCVCKDAPFTMSVVQKLQHWVLASGHTDLLYVCIVFIYLVLDRLSTCWTWSPCCGAYLYTAYQHC